MNGTAVVFGISKSGSTPISITGFATFILDTAKGVHKFKQDMIEDENGFTTSIVATDPHIELDITFVPSGAKRSDAADVAAFLSPNSLVTLSNFQVDVFNGPYVYMGDASIDLSHKEAKMSLKIRKWDDDDQNALLTQTVSG